MAGKDTPNANLRTLLGRDVDLVLMPGEIYIAQAPILISTLLGSCVSLVLYCKRQRITAISHAQLPEDKVTHKCSDLCPVKCLAMTGDQTRNKYLTCSTQNMLGQLATLGVQKEDLEVKIFGGANVLTSYTSALAIGSQNVAMAHTLVAQHRLKLVGEDTGGASGRTIYCYTESSEVLVRRHLKSGTSLRSPDSAGGGRRPEDKQGRGERG